MSKSRSKPEVNYARNNQRTASGLTSSDLARHWPKVQPINIPSSLGLRSLKYRVGPLP